ncbi:MAG: alkaline phosphatase family protein, partial [Thermoleophilaceae bacterium]|nr:alkaline phosphatase family protein [Thermoleophilaceae bacterium]
MSAELIVGPVLRYVGEREATMWVETDQACEVEVLGHSERTFHVEGHHYAIVVIGGLEPGTVTEYEVTLDGERRWPPPDYEFPSSAIRTLGGDGPLRVSFGSCRVSLPHEPPYNDQPKKPGDPGRGVDALYALVQRMRRCPHESWPHLLLLLGDQVYADEVSPDVREFIRARRDTSQPPGEEVADFQEYTRLYWESWRDPTFRWLASTVSMAMIFDDHDVIDDWNTSKDWLEEIRSQPWWDERIVAALSSYWIYQHLGNLTPDELRGDELLKRVKSADDGGPAIREFAYRADRDPDCARWSYHRDLGRGTRLLMVDSRAARVLERGPREMLDEREWEWLEANATGGFDHLLIGTSLPIFMTPGAHWLEASVEAICAGALGPRAARVGERVRQTVDLEHWPAFERSFMRFVELLRAVGSGERGPAPRTITTLSGDVHFAYLAEVEFPASEGVETTVHQAVCSPVRNTLAIAERTFMRLAAARPTERLAAALARRVGIEKPSANWRLVEDQAFDNQIATLELE